MIFFIQMFVKDTTLTMLYITYMLFETLHLLFKFEIKFIRLLFLP